MTEGQTPIRRIDTFAFARTGSHLFRYCTMGLFDRVELPRPDNQEVQSREEEIAPAALHSLSRREEGVPFSPIAFNTRATGQHGFPEKGPDPMVVLIRDPIPTFYSFFKVATERWNQAIEDPPTWLRAKCQRYITFYQTAFSLIAALPTDSLLIRYEDLTASPEPLRRLVNLVGIRPKLTPEFVHSVTRFESFTRPGKRTFYRAGDNTAWKADPQWRDILSRADLPDLSRFEHRTPTVT